MKNILVTGAKGFIGKNLVSKLRTMKDINILEYDINNSEEDLKKYISQSDYIFHLAGINRPVDVSEFEKGNKELTERVTEYIEITKKNIPLVITSSIQAEKDNDYGKSKKAAEDAVFEYNKRTGNSVFVFRLQNVFGKWCRPNYNSVVATFCNNISNDLDIQIMDKNIELELIYIDDIVKHFIYILENREAKNIVDSYAMVEPSYKVTLGKLSDMIYSFKKNMQSIYVPPTGDDFTKKLFATFSSYYKVEDMVTGTKMNIDERGSFTELVKTNVAGQFSVSTSKPGVIRGNHYHNTKMERFIVIKGKANIKFRKIDEEKIYEFEVDENNIEIVTIPVGYTHSIENIGNDEMILLLWCNEIFDTNEADTYFMEVKGQ